MRRGSKVTDLARRSVLVGVPAVTAMAAQDLHGSTHQFDQWVAEYRRLESLAFSLPEEPEGPRERLFDEMWKIERRVVETPSTDLPAIQAKLAYLRWIMTQEGSDDVVALNHVEAFVRLQTPGPWRPTKWL